MEQMTMLNTPAVINFLYSQILPHYLSTKRTGHEAYSLNVID
jgi:hypothetical protein